MENAFWICIVDVRGGLGICARLVL